VIKRALAKDREERYATAEDFAFDLGRVQEQIKKTMVSDYVNRAKVAVEKSDLPKAKEILQIVLKVDTQHSVAKELMMEVQAAACSASNAASRSNSCARTPKRRCRRELRGRARLR